MSRALSDAERRAWLRLSRTQNVGPVTFANIVARFDSVIDALAEVPRLARRGGGAELRIPSDDDAKREIAALAKLGGRMIASIEQEFPAGLAALDAPPPVISVLGHVSVLARDMVAIVGARNASALGRKFASQMAHDLKNPLASLKGALQFLEEERRRGRSLDDQHDFLGLMLEQVERLGRVADEYERIGRVEPVRRHVDVNQVVGRVVALEPFAAKGGISIVTDLAPDLPPCDIDADLVARALENLVRNALEAMPDGGNLTVRTAAGRAGNVREGRVIVSVEDCGKGMDARQAERAFNEFYTTKATGSGLGLAFVKRVAEAHGGDASLKSRVGEGTVVEMRLPALVPGE